MTIGPTSTKTEPATTPPRNTSEPDPAARTTTPRKPARAPLTNRLAVNIVIGFFVIYTLGQVLWLFFAAASDADALSAAEVFNLKDFALWDNISTLFTLEDGIYGRWYVNTIIYAGLGGIIAARISAACGYALDRKSVV